APGGIGALPELLGEALEPLDRKRRRGRQRPLDLELGDRLAPLELTREVCLSGKVVEPLLRVGVAATDRELCEHRLREELRDGDVGHQLLLRKALDPVDLPAAKAK